MKSTKRLTTLAVIIAVMVTPAFAYGAELRFQPESIGTSQGGSYTVVVTLNTQSESINAVSGTLVVDPALGAVEEVLDSGTIITYWVEPPVFDSESNSITFSGAIPGGYTGVNGILFSLVLPPYQGEQLDDAIVFANSQVLRNDGLGSAAELSFSNFYVGGQPDPVPAEIADQLYGSNRPDNIAPEPFTPQVSRDDRVYDGQWFLNFAAVDKQSGIDFYEVQESRSGRINPANWVRAESPYLLQDQELRSYIFVIAVDKRGNERIIKVAPKNPVPVVQRLWPFVVVVVAVGVAFFGYVATRKRKIAIK